MGRIDKQMVLPMDYHVHSRFSHDSQAEPQAVCEQAIELGIREICFTEHFDLHPVSAAKHTLQLRQYLAEIGRCSKAFEERLAVRCGLELGEPHLYREDLRTVISDYSFDYLLGSIHWLGDELIGPEYLSGRCFETACREYLDLVFAAAKAGEFNCLGHLDMVKRHSTGYYGRAFSFEDFREEIESILRCLVKRGIGLEVNTSGWRQGVGGPYPGLEVLTAYRNFGGEIITLGSDSHRTAQLGSGLAEGLELIRAAGFKALTTFSRGQPRWVDI